MVDLVAQSDLEGGKQSDTIDNLVSLFRDFLEAASNNPELRTSSSNNPSHADTTTQRNAAGHKRFFGLTKGLSLDSGSSNRYDYEQKYPRDRFGEETAENARIWLTYLDEAEAFDRERVEGWKETVDVLLVFAGLFSGVITTFISQASQSLQQDNTQVTASLIFETVQILRAQFSGIPINNVPKSTITPTSPFTPSTNASLVNGLWFTSLAITLSAALFAVLAKQWLYYYRVSISGTANEKVRARQLRFNGFEQWKVAAIVDLLPILLHLAVGMFLTGIMILLFPLDAHIAWAIVAITGITYTLYFISVILPIWYPECPYITSLTIYVGILFFVLRESLRWVGTVLNKGFRVVWEKVNSQVRRMIQHLVHYTLGLFQHLFVLILKFPGGVHDGLHKHLPKIISADFPNFANWREEKVKQAVSNATSLDSQAVSWLYMASADRSAHRIIARSVAVHPTMGEQFENKVTSLFRTLEASETNVVDLRYRLCLAFLTHNPHEYWEQFLSIPDHVAESVLEEEEYKSYRRFTHPGRITLLYVVDIKLPLVMWCWFLKITSHHDTVAAHILKCQQTNLFLWKFDPSRELVHSAGLVQFDSEEMGWWKLEFLFDYFGLDKPDCSSEAKSYATCYLLFITVYRQLTSADPLITYKEERQKSLDHLFSSFRSYYRSSNEFRTDFTFFKDVLCVDSFWSESMTDGARHAAASCLGPFAAEEDIYFPYLDRHNLSLIYQWCSRDLRRDVSGLAHTLSPILLRPRNRHYLSTILLNDLNATYHLSMCLKNMESACHISQVKATLISSRLMDLLDSVKVPLSTVFYNPSVLAQIWKMVLIPNNQDAKQFFLLVKSKLDREKLNELLSAMNHQVQSNYSIMARPGFSDELQASLRVFEQMIGRYYEQSTPSGSLSNRNHDNEERAQVPGPSERQNHSSVANWRKKAFGC